MVTENPEIGQRVETPWPDIRGEVEEVHETGDSRTVVLIGADGRAWRIEAVCRGYVAREEAQEDEA